MSEPLQKAIADLKRHFCAAASLIAYLFAGSRVPLGRCTFRNRR